MKLVKTLAALVLAAATCVAAPADKPTSQSIEKLMQVMHLNDMMTSLQKQLKAMMDQMYADPSVVGDLTPEKKAALAKAEDKILADMSGLLSWDNMKEITISTYQESLTQGEVDALTAFYQTPEGASIVVKLPQVMQSSMLKMQAKVRPMVQRMISVARSSADQIKAGNLAATPENLIPDSKAGS